MLVADLMDSNCYDLKTFKGSLFYCIHTSPFTHWKKHHESPRGILLSYSCYHSLSPKTSFKHTISAWNLYLRVTTCPCQVIYPIQTWRMPGLGDMTWRRRRKVISPGPGSLKACIGYMTRQGKGCNPYITEIFIIKPDILSFCHFVEVLNPFKWKCKV